MTLTSEEDAPPANLVERLLEPGSIAVLGASDDLRKPGGRVLRSLLLHGFRGEVFPLNHRSETVQGIVAHASIADLPHVPDLVVVTIPMAHVLPVMRECITAGAKTFIMLTAFGPESDEERTRLREMLSEHPDVRVLGPNSLGAHGARARLASSFMTATDGGEFSFAPSDVFIITQSGGVGAYLFSTAQAIGYPIGGFLSTGIELNVTFWQILRDIVDHCSPALIFGYVEGADDEAGFLAALAHARSRGVPVILLRAGVTPAARAAIGRHSGLRTWMPDEWHERVSATGAVTLPTIDQVLDAGRALTHPIRAGGDRVTIVAASGGAGILMTDAAEQSGLRLADWSEEERSGLRTLLPDTAIVDNPLDATGALLARLSTLREVLRMCAAHDRTDVVLLSLGNMPHVEDRLFAAIRDAADATEKLLVVTWAGGSLSAIRRLGEHGILAFPDPMRAAAAIRHMLDERQDSGRGHRSTSPG